MCTATLLRARPQIRRCFLGAAGDDRHLVQQFFAGLYVFQSVLVARSFRICPRSLSLVLGSHASRADAEPVAAAGPDFWFSGGCLLPEWHISAHSLPGISAGLPKRLAIQGPNRIFSLVQRKFAVSRGVRVHLDSHLRYPENHLWRDPPFRLLNRFAVELARPVLVFRSFLLRPRIPYVDSSPRPRPAGFVVSSFVGEVAQALFDPHGCGLLLCHLELSVLGRDVLVRKPVPDFPDSDLCFRFSILARTRQQAVRFHAAGVRDAVRRLVVVPPLG